MVDAIASAGPGYKAPPCNALMGKELDEELECVKKQLEPLKSHGSLQVAQFCLMGGQIKGAEQSLILL